MAIKLHKKHCWSACRIQLGAGFVEIRERKWLQSIAALFGIGSGLLFGAMLVVSLGRAVDACSLISAALVTTLPIAITFMLYRPPRVARLFAAEQLGQRYRTFFGIKSRSRWFDLRSAPVAVEPTHIVTYGKKDREGGGAALLGCLFALLGPLGLLLSLGVLREKVELRERVYAVSALGLPEPVLLLVSRGEAERVVSLYEAIRGEQGGG